MAVSTIVSRPDSSRNPKHNQFLNPLEAAAYLGLSHQTLARWRMLKVGPAYSRLNNFKIKYSVADLDAFANAGRVEHHEQK